MPAPRATLVAPALHSTLMSSPNPSEREVSLAVVAVHGIADQRRGDTGLAVALQLAAVSGAGVQSLDLPLPVPPLDPALPYQRWQPAQPLQQAWKSLRQSWRSDFLDGAIGAAPGSAAHGNSARGAADAPAAAQADTGTRFTDYLLAKAQGARQQRAPGEEPPAATSSAPEAATISVSTVRGARLDADVYEMHWADLSRLSSGVARIVAELFTLLFHLARLGADALSLQSHLDGPGELTWVGRAHRAADWLFSRPLALLALQLVVCALVLTPALLLHAHLRGVVVAVAVLAGIGAAAALVYWRRWRWRLALPAGGAVALGCWVTLQPHLSYAVLMASWLVLLTYAYVALMGYCEQRFRGVWGLGLALYACTLGCVLTFGLGAGFNTKQGWLDGVLGALEAVLLAHAVSWALLALLVVASVVLSEWALWRGRRVGRDHGQVLVTARLGLFTSVGAFLVCLMVGFMLLGWALEGLLKPESYSAWWFVDPGAGTNADIFFKMRTSRTAGSFALVALALLVLLGFVVLIFAPSMLRELRLATEPRSSSLGAWLSHGYRAIERLVRVWGWLVAPAAAAMAVGLLAAQAARLDLVITLPWLQARVSSSDDTLQALSDDWLGAIMIAVAGTTAGLLAIGKVAIKQLKSLRAPLDAALDVDNHFREFPRHAISRVRIVERYVALLDHLRQQGYARVLIVAHSQGTVITADLLRYLQQRHLLGQAAPTPGQVDVERLRRWLDSIDLSLLTVGSPLRQLYALRFPARYDWVMEPVQAAQPATPARWLGPQPHALGLRRWSNLWGSGDYVGRWLWAAQDGSRPAPLAVDDARYGALTQEGTDARGVPWKDRCLGGDAHTHYFDIDQHEVAAEMWALARRAAA